MNKCASANDGPMVWFHFRRDCCKWKRLFLGGKWERKGRSEEEAERQQLLQMMHDNGRDEIDDVTVVKLVILLQFARYGIFFRGVALLEGRKDLSKTTRFSSLSEYFIHLFIRIKDWDTDKIESIKGWRSSWIEDHTMNQNLS